MMKVETSLAHTNEQTKTHTHTHIHMDMVNMPFRHCMAKLVLCTSSDSTLYFAYFKFGWCNSKDFRDIDRKVG